MEVRRTGNLWQAQYAARTWPLKLRWTFSVSQTPYSYWVFSFSWELPLALGLASGVAPKASSDGAETPNFLLERPMLQGGQI